MDVRYSVYSAKNDLPIIVYGTIPQCANAIGVKYETFKSYASRQRSGAKRAGKRKWIIVREKEDEN